MARYDYDKEMKAQALEQEYLYKMQTFEQAKERAKTMSDRELLEQIYLMLKVK